MSRFRKGHRPVTPAGGARAVPAGGGRQPHQETAVERREAPRARSRRSSRGDCSVARAAPEARAGGNIRPRGAAHDPGASRRSTPASVRGASCNASAKLGRARVARTDLLVLHRESGGGGPRVSAVEGAFDSPLHFRRKRFVEARAPSTALRAVPLPPLFAGEDERIIPPPASTRAAARARGKPG